MSLVLPMTTPTVDRAGAARRAPVADGRTLRVSAAAAQRAAGFGDRTGRRWAGLLIVALHVLLLWALARYGVVRDLPTLVPPMLVQLIAPAPTARPSATATLPSMPQVRMPDPPAWVPPPEVHTSAPPEPAVGLQSVAPPTAAVVTVAPPVPTRAPAAIAAVALVAPPKPAQPQTLPTSALRFSQAPVVEYPRASRRNKESGVVLIRAWVGAAGGASSDVRVERSSGFVRLDEAAVRAVQQARFSPTVQDGQPVEGWAVFPIQFALES